jgi:transcriptional regulator with GAF, ATPase, and Fis domain
MSKKKKNRLQNEMHEFEAAKIREALSRTDGNLKNTAEILDMPTTTLTSTLQRRHPKLLEYARTLRAKKGNERGRPRIEASERTKKAVKVAWRKADGILAEAARLLKLPASSTRELLIRYEMIEAE